MNQQPTKQEDEFLSMLTSHKGVLYKIANSYCTNLDNRKDLTQEIIFQLWKSFDNYKGISAPVTWIYRVALNVAISYVRKEKTKEKMQMHLSENFVNFIEEDEHHDQGSNLELPQKYITELKELDKAIILLHLDQKNVKEIAEVTGLSETNIMTKISRIKAVLKQKFLLIKVNRYG